MFIYIYIHVYMLYLCYICDSHGVYGYNFSESPPSNIPSIHVILCEKLQHNNPLQKLSTGYLFNYTFFYSL